VFVKSHYSGLAISYNSRGSGVKSLSPSTPLPDGSFSRINRQKRQIHDAVEWIRRNATYKPLIGVLTVPVESDYKLTNENVSKFFQNLRKNYDCKNYVWVREYQGGGRPHFHFVADSKYLDAVAISRYWSGLFDCDNLNSIRLGTDPKHPPRKFFVDSPTMSRYLTKYLGAGTVKDKDGKKVRVLKVNSEEQKKRIKTFAISEEAGKKSKPLVYKCEYKWQKKTVISPVFSSCYQACDIATKKNIVVTDIVQLRSAMVKSIIQKSVSDSVEKIERDFVLTENSEGHLIEVYGSIPDHLKQFDDSKFSWICPNPLHKVYYGVPKRFRN
jgi:hypothetical protein